jgi:Ca2+-transporting ATPase
MTRPPRKKTEGLLDGMKGFILVAGALSALVTLGLFAFALSSEWSAAHARSLAFNALVFFELVLVFGCRSDDKGILELPPWTNPKLVFAVVVSALLQIAITQVPFFHEIFDTVSLDTAAWGLVALGALTAIGVPYIVRFVGRLRRAQTGKVD